MLFVNFNNGHSDQCAMYLIIVFTCISIIISSVEHLFMCLLVTFISSLEKWLFKFSAHFSTVFLFSWLLSSVLLLICVQLLMTLWTTAHQASLSFSISQSLLRFMSIESVMSTNHINFYNPLLLQPSIFPSIRVFSYESALHIRWPKWGASASASVFPVNIQDWFPLGWTGLISLQSKGLSRVFSNTTVQKHQFFGAQPSSQYNSHIHT